MAGPDLSKTGPKLNLVAGGSLDVIESTRFSSPTGLQEPPRAPGDPPRRPPRRFGKIAIFLKKNGVIAFLLPLNLFKSKGGGEGFRSFKIKDSFLTLF